MNLDAFELLKTHLALDCIGIDDEGYLTRLPGPCPAPLPRFYVAELAGTGNHVRFTRRDVSLTASEKLLALPPGVALEDRAAVRQVLAIDAPCLDVRRNLGYVFAEDPGVHNLNSVKRLSAADDELVARFDARIDAGNCAVFAVLDGNRIASACTSSRETEQAAEAWVQTVPAQRRSGLGRRVVAAWGHYQTTQGKIPFYTLVHGNMPSQRLAESLGLIHYLSDASYA